LAGVFCYCVKQLLQAWLKKCDAKAYKQPINGRMRDFMAFDYAILDVFTQTKLGGNPLAVVLGADDLSDGQMQDIASEFNLSETVFVCEPLHPAHSASLRIFTPARELPFAGHPTVGTACYLAQRKFAEMSGSQNAMLVLEERAGLVRVAVALKAQKAAYALFDLPKPSQKIDVEMDKSAIAAALGLSPMEIGFENHVPSVYSAGVPFTLVPVKNLTTLNKALPRLQSWEEAFPYEAPEAYLYTRDTQRHEHDFATRMFAPSMGIPEDPATGAAVAAFSGAILHFDGLQEGEHSFKIEQGYEMGRPSLIELVMTLRERKLKSSQIGGHAVLLAEGKLYMDGSRKKPVK